MREDYIVIHAVVHIITTKAYGPIGNMNVENNLDFSVCTAPTTVNERQI